MSGTHDGGDFRFPEADESPPPRHDLCEVDQKAEREGDADDDEHLETGPFRGREEERHGSAGESEYRVAPREVLEGERGDGQEDDDVEDVPFTAKAHGRGPTGNHITVSQRLSVPRTSPRDDGDEEGSEATDATERFEAGYERERERRSHAIRTHKRVRSATSDCTSMHRIPSARRVRVAGVSPPVVAGRETARSVCGGRDG